MTDNVIGFPGGETSGSEPIVDDDWVAVLENALELAREGRVSGTVLVYSHDDGDDDVTKRYWGQMTFNSAARTSMAMDLIRQEMLNSVLMDQYLD